MVRIFVYFILSVICFNSVYAITLDTENGSQEEKLDKNYLKMIKQFCKELKKDGRSYVLNQIAIDNSVSKSSCDICTDFFQKTRVFCTANLEWVKKNNSMQREPSLMTIYATSNLFNELASDKKIYDDATKIAMLLSYSLKNYEPMTKGEKEYFDILVEYIQTPFKKSLEEMPSVAQSEKENEDAIFKDLFGN